MKIFIYYYYVFCAAAVQVEAPTQEVTVVASRSGFTLNCTASGSHINDMAWLRDNQTIASQHFEQTSTLHQGTYMYGQTEATTSSLVWSNYSATCNELSELSGSYSCVVSGRVGSVHHRDETSRIVVDLQRKSQH